MPRFSPLAHAIPAQAQPALCARCVLGLPFPRSGVLWALLAVATLVTGPSPRAAEPEWKPLFNGRDLEGWTPKIRGEKLGDNFANTFRVEDGVLKVGYDPQKYPQFGEKFGHLFYNQKFSHYRLRVEYRFTGNQCPGGPGWA
ncbi:MAG: DUF1080 domain-containing protein, partial [Planctomycetaceae bacterium]